MQNKPNFKDAQMNVSNIITMNYKNFIPLAGYKNKPNSNPIKPCPERTCPEQGRRSRMGQFRQRPKMNVNLYVIEDYDNDTTLRHKKTNPKQTQFPKWPK